MKTSREKPQMYDLLHQKFGIDWDRGTAITIKDTVYSKFPLAPDVEVHEQVHLEQQNNPKYISFEVWLARYFDEPEFRLEQEVEAYQAQVKFIRTSMNLTRNERRFKISNLAKTLASGMYGFVLTYQKALDLIS